MLNERNCYLCGSDGILQVHHIMNGWANRKLCDEDGLMIYVCPGCHERIHADAELRKELKAVAEKEYLKNHSFEDWMKRYGKNYIDTIS